MTNELVDSDTLTGMRLVAVWPCGTWCNSEDLEQYGWMSDDYKLITVGEFTTDETIEAMISHM